MKKPGPREYYELSATDRDLDCIEAELPEYLKLASICWLLRIGVATPEGLVLTSASSKAITAALEFAQSRGWTRFMLRHDRPLGRPRTVQGGFLVGLDELGRWVEKFVGDGVCILLEPLDPLRNGYNVSCLLERDSALVEIAGPGFDASDLQRGEVQPHERGILDVELRKIRNTSICTEESYLSSVAERERKVWWKYARRELSQQRWRKLTSKEEAACRQFIVASRGGPLAGKYVPMNSKLQTQYLLSVLPALLQWRASRKSYPAVVAGSFVQDGNFRVWDVNTAARWLG